MSEVVGNKTDSTASNSLYGLNEVQSDHIHSACKCYPTLANSVTVA